MLLNPSSEHHSENALQVFADTNKDPKAPIAHRIHLLVCIVGLFITSLVSYGFYTGYRISTTYAPLIDAAMEIKLEATEAQLGLEEVLHENRDEAYHTVLLHVEEAMWYLRAMLEGGKNFEGTFVPVPDKDLFRRVKEAQRDFGHLKTMVLQRLKLAYAQKTDKEFAREHDARFRAFITEVDRIETSLQELMAHSRSRFRIIQAILIVACVTIAIVTGIYVRRVEKQRQDNYRDLRHANVLLEKEIAKRESAEAKVQKAYGGLELSVKERTRDLDMANQKLSHEVEERRKAELDLLKNQARLRNLTSELSLSEERERRRIAQVLHDSIGQNLSAMSMSELTMLRGLDPCDFDVKLDGICDLIKRMIEDTRRLIIELAPATLYELGLIAAVEELIDQIRMQNQIQVELRGDPRAIINDEGLRVFLFRSIRELLSNSIRHAQAQTIRVSIQVESPWIRIEVYDDGIGFESVDAFTASDDNSGLGIFQIHERLQYFRGSLELKSQPGSGTHAVLITPIK